MTKIKNFLGTIGTIYLLSKGTIGMANENGNSKPIDKNITTTTYVETHKKDITQNLINNNIGFDDRKKDLESVVFEDSAGLKFFRQRLSFNTFVTAKIVDRQTFNNLKGSFLIKKTGNTYDLCLPDSMRFSELPAIIKKVNLMTFGQSMPEYASTIEVKQEIEFTIKYLLSIKNGTNGAEIQKAVDKYYQLFQQYFPGENPNITTTNKNVDQDYVDDLQKIAKDRQLIENVEDILVESLYNHFLESFFEMGSDMLGETGNVKKTINMENLKKELAIVKKTGNKDIIAKKEKEVINKVIFEVHNFFVKGEKSGVYKTDLEQSLPSKIIESQVANCLGLAIMSHDILAELGIQHNSRIMLGHIALSVKLSNGKEYFYDPRQESILLDQKLVKKIGVNSEQLLIGQDTIFTIKGDDEKMLMGGILFNKGNNDGEKNIKTKIALLEKSIDMYKNNSIFCIP